MTKLINDKTPGKLRDTFRLQIEGTDVEGRTTRTSKYQKIDQISLKTKKWFLKKSSKFRQQKQKYPSILSKLFENFGKFWPNKNLSAVVLIEQLANFELKKSNAGWMIPISYKNYGKKIIAQ